MAVENPIIARHGEMLDLGPCIAGKNLNLLALRGHAPLDVLAEISAPDVYDQVDNPTGTQRDLKPKHAEECFDYAVGSLAVAPEDEPRCFPEILLNARDANLIEIYNLDDDTELFDMSSFTGDSELASPFVGLRIRLSDLDFPKPKVSPQISRVDGNHRLSETDDVLAADWNERADDGGDEDFPIVPFAILMGLSHIQEARLFRDINGEHEGMETAHLDTMTYRITDPSQMRTDPKLRPLWIAHKLTEKGRAFDGMVFMGGSKAGVKKAQGTIPPIKINALKSTIAAQLKAAPTVTVELADKPDQLMELLDRFWKNVKELFPEAWQDKREYILLQAIGLGAFAKFGGITLERAWDAGNIDPDEIRAYLAPVAASVSLKRDDYPGIAGAGGAQFIAELLIQSADSDQVKALKNLKKLGTEAGSSTPLDDE